MPPILEVFVVWHPGDEGGRQIGEALLHHFHSVAYSGLAGGAVEVYLRGDSWDGSQGPPRPTPIHSGWPAAVSKPQFVAYVPVISRGLAVAVEKSVEWRDYIAEIFEAGKSKSVVVAPIRNKNLNIEGTTLETIASQIQSVLTVDEDDFSLIAREVVQAIAQKVDASEGRTGRIRVFVSHTKRSSPTEKMLNEDFFLQVREVLADTRLGEFFDAADLQVGLDWAASLDQESSTDALLMVRTDNYASREWTQREVLSAKTHDLPIVSLLAFHEGEDRGSFLMDHVPSIPIDWIESRKSIELSLSRLVDEALKRSLWLAQSSYLAEQGFDWLPVHSPEPVTVAPWLHDHKEDDPGDRHLWIIHPDPPLGEFERRVVIRLCELAGFNAKVDILTPRTFAARGGVVEHG